MVERLLLSGANPNSVTEEERMPKVSLLADFAD
jgi:hypothetical protein